VEVGWPELGHRWRFSAMSYHTSLVSLIEGLIYLKRRKLNHRCIQSKRNYSTEQNTIAILIRVSLNNGELLFVWLAVYTTFPSTVLSTSLSKLISTVNTTFRIHCNASETLPSENLVQIDYAKNTLYMSSTQRELTFHFVREKFACWVDRNSLRFYSICLTS